MSYLAKDALLNLGVTTQKYVLNVPRRFSKMQKSMNLLLTSYKF